MQIKVTYRKDRKNWMVDARKIGGNRTYFQDKIEAQSEAARIEKLYFNNMYIPKTITGEYAINKYIEKVKVSTVTKGEKNEKISSANKLNKTIVSGKEFKDWDLSKLILPGVRTPDDILQDLLQSKPMLTNQRNGKPTATKTRINTFKHFKQIFNYFVSRSYISVNPVDVKELPIPDDYIVGSVTAEKVSGDVINLIMSNIDPKFALIFQMAISTGFRQAEQRALMWKHIDWDNKKIILDQSIRVGDYGEEVSPKLKTKTSKRKLPISEKLYQSLKQEYLRQGRPNNPNTFIFRNRNNRPISGDMFRKALKEAIVKSNIEDFRWHDLRHYFASIMFDTMGVNYALVSQLLGHASVEFTRKQYVHWFENEDRDNKILEGMAQAGI
tara:strand:+ start:248 stop:1399 length:1152 start_codon:yes stop_codon:yes gene_type:complete